MWKTIHYYKNGKPKLDINEQGVIYSYSTKQLLKPKKSRDKYPYYSIALDGKTQYLHVLVAKAFPEICGKYFEGCHVHHKDFNSANNAAENLMVVTTEEHGRIHREHNAYVREKSEVKEILEDILKGTYKSAYRLYCRKAKILKNGLAPVEVAFYFKGKRLFRNTGKYENPYTFNSKTYSL